VGINIYGKWLSSYNMQNIINKPNGFIVIDTDFHLGRYIGNDGLAWDLKPDEINNLITGGKDNMEENQVQAMTPEVVPTQPTQEALAKGRAALDVQGNPRFVQIMVQVSQALQVAQRMPPVQDQVGYNTGSHFLVALKGTEKELKQLKVDALRFPKLYEKSVKNAMRPVEDMLGKSINLVEGVLLKWVEVVEAEQKRQEEIAAQAAPEIIPKVLTDESPSVEALKNGGGAEGMSPPPPPPLTTNVSTEAGSVHVRTYEDIEVVDMMALLKAIVSQADRNNHCTLDMVQPNMKVIREAVQGRRKIPGVEVGTKKGLATRSK